MKRVVLALMSTITGLVMLLGFKSHSPSAPAVIGSTGTVPVGVGSAGDPAAAGKPTTAPTAAATADAARTVTGAAADTRYGPVQVQIRLAGSKITGVQILHYPTDSGEDQQINGYALPILIDETVAAQNAKVDAVSGATYTTDGYLRSLQSALDQAGISR